MKIVTVFDHPTGNDFPTPAGEHFTDTFEMTIDKNGHKTLTVSGKEDWYGKIQESKESCTIENIIKRITNGQYTPTTLINVTSDGGLEFLKNGNIVDYTQMPENFMEQLRLQVKLENIFNQLPVEERAKYNHNVGEYLNAISKEMEKATNESAKVSNDSGTNKDASGEPSGV